VAERLAAAIRGHEGATQWQSGQVIDGLVAQQWLRCRGTIVRAEQRRKPLGIVDTKPKFCLQTAPE
jgi:hypothetical protein